MSQTGHTAVIGAGSWGTALANLLARKGEETLLWSYEADVAQGINEQHRNPVYLPDSPLDARLKATASIEQAVRGASVVVSVSPSHTVRRVMADVAPFLEDGALIVSASKGIEEGSLKMMDGVLTDVLPADVARGVAYLSGPSFAREVADAQPTAVTMASHDEARAVAAQELFQTDYFRVYTTTDVTGVELGGSVKNVIAIASGVIAGLGFGHNTTAALLTRGLAEITRLGVRMGADPLTFAGLAGMGDLVLTCTGGLSRNRSVGVRLGEGKDLDQILEEMSEVAEGVRTTRSTYDLSRREQVEMPIVEEVYAILFEGRSAREAVESLMVRDPKPERTW